jgi:hypothetical protein
MTDVAGGSDHRCTVTIGIHRPAATLAAVADGIEAIQHGVFEKSVMHMTALPGSPLQGCRAHIISADGEDGLGRRHRHFWVGT